MPFSPDIYRQPQNVIPVETHRLLPASVDSDDTLNMIASVGDTPNPTANEKYFRTSLSHGRAICRELHPDSYVWDDQGYLFTIHSIKGTILTDILSPEADPPACETPAEALLALWPRGLNEQTSIEYVKGVIQTSIAFRTHGLVTEYVQSVSTLDSIVMNGQAVNLHHQLSKLATHRRKWLTNHPLMKNAKRDVLEKVLDGYEQKMNSAELYVIERLLPVAERLEDILSARTIAGVTGRLLPSQQWSRLQRITHPEISEFPDITTKTDLQRYFREWLPAQMGTYVGRIHKADSVHGGTHAQNWMPIGALTDCDSVHGKLIGQDPPTDEDIQQDLDDATSVFQQMNDSAIIWEIFDYQYDPDDLSETFYQHYLRV